MFSIACILLASLCVVDSSAIMRCSVNATFNFVEDETPNITCSGFPVGYWSLTGPSTGGQEIRIGYCSKCSSGGACSRITNSTDYNITINGDNSTLFFVDNLSGNNRSTITCSSENNDTCVTSTINIIKAPVQCQHANNCIEIVENQPTPLTCQGGQDKDIYWSVTRPSTPETTIGNCSKCATKHHLPCTCLTHNGDYSITRTGDTTTAVSILQFVNNVATNDNSTIKCSASDDNQPLVSVSIKVIPAYRLPACNNNTVDLYENSNRRIRCEGMELSQDMYWSITYPNMTEHTVAVCGNCENETCPQCDVNIDDFSVERNQTFSVLRMIAGNDRDKEGAVVKCSKSNNATHDQCQLSIRYYALPQCTDGRVYVSETEPQTHITCDGVDFSHRINWTLTDDSGQVTDIAECYGNGTCTELIDDVTVSKNESTSTLTFVKNVRQGDNQTLNCVRRNGETSASCRIRTFYSGAPENTSLVVDSNFTVTGRVHVNKMYEPDGNVACLWYYSPDNVSIGVVPHAHLNLSSFTDVNGLEYQRGTCNMTMQLNSSETTHLFYVEIRPGDGPQIADAITIVKPGPNLTTTCPDYVTEGSNLTCECSHLTSQHGNPPATISWRDVTDTAVLDLPSVHRNLSGTDFVCTSVWGEETPDGVLSSENYTLLVAYPGAPENTSLVVDSNFTVTGRVHVNKVYEPDGNVACLWYYSPDNVSIGVVLSSATHLNLSSFTDVNGLEYQRGTCTITMQLNSSETNHYFYVEIQPGDGRKFADAIKIEKPGPNLTTTCPDYVSEGSDLTCECSHLTAQHGNPPATISWRDVTDIAVLDLQSVHRNLSGTEFVCTSVWGEETPDGVLSSKNYTLLVAYPGSPENTSLVVDSNFTVTGRVHVNKVYEPDGSVACLWYYSPDNVSIGVVSSSATHLNLSSFTDVNGLEYQRGTSTITMQLNSSETTHYFYVEIQPGDGRKFANAIKIEKPGPNRTTTCPDYVSEGSDLTCECSHLTAQHGNPPATISWRDVTDIAVLDLQSVHRNLSGTEFVCTSVWGEETSDEVLSSENYTLLVAYPGTPENTSLVVDSNFTVTGRVHVNKVYKPDGRVSCLWYYSLDNASMRWVPRDATHLNLSSFTDVNGLEYQRGICTMTMQLNTLEMTHYFHVEIQPGGGPQFAESVTIKKPGTTLTTTCPDYVSEGSDLTCECSHLTAQHGNPPATISWRDAMDTAVLHVPSVHRNQNGTQFVCTSVWGAGTEVVHSTYIYTLLVAYDDPEPFPWVVVGVAVGATVLVIIVVIAIVVVVYRRRAHRKGAVENNAEDNATDDDFEEHINNLYQSSDLDTPFHLQPLQAYTAPQVSNTVNADTNGIQEMTQTARPDDAYNVLGSTPHGDQKAGAVYNHLTKF